MRYRVRKRKTHVCDDVSIFYSLQDGLYHSLIVLSININCSTARLGSWQSISGLAFLPPLIPYPFSSRPPLLHVGMRRDIRGHDAQVGVHQDKAHRCSSIRVLGGGPLCQARSCPRLGCLQALLRHWVGKLSPFQEWSGLRGLGAVLATSMPDVQMREQTCDLPTLPDPYTRP